MRDVKIKFGDIFKSSAILPPLESIKDGADQKRDVKVSPSGRAGVNESKIAKNSREIEVYPKVAVRIDKTKSAINISSR